MSVSSNLTWGTLKFIKIWSSFFAIPDFFFNFAAQLNNKRYETLQSKNHRQELVFS